MSTACGEQFTSAEAEDAGRDTGSSGGAGVGGAPLVLNEVDYDNPELDTAEFVEIFNATSSEQSLDGLAVVFVNGASGMKTEYARVNLSGLLPAGAFALIASTSVASAPGALRFPFPNGGEENQIQNGGSGGDAIGLISLSDGRLIDALSYTGSVLEAEVQELGKYDFVEGTPSAVTDDGPGSLVRLPDGADLNDAATDWKASSTPTPGFANQP